jgi:GT2 family glycosyltransferase
VFFVRRDFFTAGGGFDERFVWSFEETDLIRQAQVLGKSVVDLQLPIQHASPDQDTEEDAEYKRQNFDLSSTRYYAKWGR